VSGADRAWVGYWGCLATSAGTDGVFGLFFFVAAVFFLVLVLAADYAKKKGCK
jgi:hypothetical protein